jgi:membrane protein YqaA with SNARE-associated domain
MDDAFIGEDASLASLFVSSFLAATLLPGGSEAVLFGVLRLHPQLFWPAIAIATLGNTLGGLTSYLIGRILPAAGPDSGEGARHARARRAMAWVRRYGSPALLFAWAPVIGDALCVAAGWLRVNAAWSALWMAAGKFLRYLVIAQWSA